MFVPLVGLTCNIPQKPGILSPGGDTMLGFLAGCLVGGTVGMTAACLCTAAKEADRQMGAEQYE